MASQPTIQPPNPPTELEIKAAELLPALKESLGTEATGVSDASLLKFLHWKPDVNRAASRFRSYRAWRKDHQWAYDDKDQPLRASADVKLRKFLEGETVVAPEGLVAKNGSAVIVGRLRNNDMNDGRTPEDVCRGMLYTIDRVLERREAQVHGVTVFHDMTGIGRNNLSPTVAKLLLGALIGSLPVRLNAMYIYNAPAFFPAFFSVISLMLPSKMKSRIFFVKSMDQVYDPIDKERLLVEHGGSRKHDAAAWLKAHMAREASGNFGSLSDCVQ